MSDHSKHFDESVRRCAEIKTQCETANEESRRHILAGWKEQILEACADALFKCENITHISVIEGTISHLQDLNYLQRENAREQTG